MKQFFILLALVGGLTLHAQAEQFVDSIILSGLPFQVMVEDVTSTPIIVQQYSYVGLDRMTGDSLWSVERKGFSGITQKLSDNYDEAVDVVDILDVPFVFVNGVLVDVRNGHKLIEESEGVKLFRASHLIAGKDLSLIEVSTKGGSRLYGFSAKDGTRRFALELKEKNGLGFSGNASAEAGKAPMKLDEEHLLYYGKQHLYRINLTNGEITWDYDAKVNEARIVNDGMHLLLIYPPGGLSLADNGKEIQLLKMDSGAPLYKKPFKLDGNVRGIESYDGGLAVMHSNGMNIYDFNGSTSGRWKKDFKEGGIKSFEVTDKGMMVYFKNKRMLIDPTSGEEKMKKPEKLDRPAWTGNEPKGEFTFNGENIKMWGSNQIEVKGKKIGFSQIAFDAENNRIVTATLVKEVSSFRKEVYSYDITAYDLADLSTVVPKRYNIGSGLGELEVVNGRILGYAQDGFTMFHATVGQDSIQHGQAYFYNPIKRKGAKTGKLVGKLLGGGSQEEPLTDFPTYVQSDIKFYDDVKQGNFSSENYPQAPGDVFVMLGTPNRNSIVSGLPYVFVIEKATGKELMRDLLIYDNSQFTLDPEENLVYVIHGKSVRWYKF